MKKYIETLKHKAKYYFKLAKIWYLDLDSKKKFILWLYVACAVILFVGTLFIIVYSVFQAEKFDTLAKREAFINRVENLNTDFEELQENYTLEMLEEAKSDLEINFEGAAKELETNNNLLKKLPISDPITE